MFFRRGSVSLFLLWIIFSAKLLTEIQILPRFLNKIFENSRAEKEKRFPCGKASRKLSGKLSRQHYPCTRSLNEDLNPGPSIALFKIFVSEFVSAYLSRLVDLVDFHSSALQEYQKRALQEYQKTLFLLGLCYGETEAWGILDLIIYIKGPCLTYYIKALPVLTGSKK